MDQLVGSLSLFVFIAMTVISVVSIVQYAKNKAGMRDKHRRIMSRLTPIRQLSPQEKQLFKLLYRKNIDDDQEINVYRHQGPVGYISITVKHTESKEFTLGDIMVASPGLNRLCRVLPDVDFTSIAQDTAQRSRNKTMALLEQYVGTESANGDKLVAELKAVQEEFSHSFEVIFTDNNTRRSGFLVQFDDWSLAETGEAYDHRQFAVS